MIRQKTIAMPAKTTRRTLSRQWELLKLLPSRGAGKTASELARELNEAGFVVSKRQVERDLWDLLEAFHLDCNEKSAPFGWKWPPGASAELPGLTLAEALSLRLIKDTVQPLLPASMLHALESRFALAEKKLASQVDDRSAAQWPDKVRSVPPTQPLLAPAIATDVLENVQEALLADRQIDADYFAMESDAPHPIRLHPLALVNRGPVTYLVATAWEYSDVRLYALHRITRANRLDEPSLRPVDFDLDQYIASGALQFINGKPLRLKARVSDYLARILKETPLSADQELDGNQLKATVQDTWQLMWWILGQGDAIEVLEPVRLREQVSDGLKRAMAAYYSTIEIRGR